MQINSIVDAARITSRAEAEAGMAVGAGGKRPREGVDAMAELEAEAVAAMGLGAGGLASAGRTALSGFVSAGVIQQGGEKDERAAGGAQAKHKAPAAGGKMLVVREAKPGFGLVPLGYGALYIFYTLLHFFCYLVLHDVLRMMSHLLAPVLCCAANPEEIDIEADEDDGGSTADMDVAQKAVPAAVFGSLAALVAKGKDRGGGGDGVGECLKKQRT